MLCRKSLYSFPVTFGYIYRRAKNSILVRTNFFCVFNREDAGAAKYTLPVEVIFKAFLRASSLLQGAIT